MPLFFFNHIVADATRDALQRIQQAMDKVNGMLRPFGYVYYNDVDRQLEVRPGEIVSKHIKRTIVNSKSVRVKKT